jgi:hypothetical protein
MCNCTSKVRVFDAPRNDKYYFLSPSIGATLAIT